MSNNRLLLLSLLLFVLLSSLLFALRTVPYSWDNWQPESCRLRNCYCEPFHTGLLVLQPVSAYSNLGYLLVGILILGYLPALYNPQNSRTNLMRVQPAYALTYGTAILAAGLFSFFSHASLTRVGEWFDLIGVYTITGFLLLYNLSRWVALPGQVFASLYAAILALLGIQMAVVPQWQQLCIGVLIGSALLLEAVVRLFRKPHIRDRYLVAAGICFALGGGIWLLNGRAPNCNPASGNYWHVAWHLLSAAAAGLLFLYYLSEEQRSVEWLFSG